jgi:tetratricopeptide (TPR) repeat protein
LLSDAERAMLAQLSVFEGGFELQAAEAVVQPPGGGAWLPDVVQSLVEKSLLRRQDGDRFDMLRTVHDYAAERLEDSGVGADAEQRHWLYFASIDELKAAEHRAVEVENLVLACRRASAKDPVSAARLLVNAWAALRLTGPFRVGIDLARLVEESLPEQDLLHAYVNRVRGAALLLLGDAEEARANYAKAIAAAAESGDGDMLAQTQCLLAELELAQGNGAAAEHLLAVVKASPAAHSNAVVRYMCLSAAGKLQMRQSSWTEARANFEEALELARRLGNRRWQGGIEGNLGVIARAEGRHELARRHWQDGLQCAADVGDRQWAGNMRSNLGLLLHELGEHEAARVELSAALEIASSVGHRLLEATVHCNLGLVADAVGDSAAACLHQQQAAEAAAAAGSSLLEGQARGYLGVALALSGRHAAAAHEIDCARRLITPRAEAASSALVLFQAALVAAADGKADLASRDLERAGRLLAETDERVDPEIAAMQERALRAVQAVKVTFA